MPVDEEIAAEVRSALDPGVLSLLREAGSEDRGAIHWGSFSDDDGDTRIVFRAYRLDAARVLSLLTEDDLLQGLNAARAAGLSKVYWGIDDEVARGERAG